MLAHLRANLWLLVLTVVLCCVLYPLTLWLFGQAFFRAQAEGSLVNGPDGKPVGSLLIAQPFNGDQYFQPRPSAANYDASASGASNWGASNPKLRDRVARQLGPMVEYRDGKPVGPDVEAWLTPERVAAWAKRSPDAAGWWYDSDKDGNKKLLDEWQKANPQVAQSWKKENPDKEPAPADLAVAHFAHFAGRPRDKDGRLQPESARQPVQAVFFDSWLQEHPKADMQRVPADMVMASGSGLDPHITLANALYQARHRVAAARTDELIKAKKLQVDDARRKQIEEQVYQALAGLLEDKAGAPLNGLAGVLMVNVLEVNLAVPERLEQLAEAGYQAPPRRPRRL
jgi:K+-transporting ATPase ATPase C chain